MFKFLSLLLILLLSSCAQKKQQKGNKNLTPPPASAPIEVKSDPKPVESSVVISWEAAGKKYSISRRIVTNETYSLDKPFTISKEIPDTLEVNFQSVPLVQKIGSFDLMAKILNTQESQSKAPAIILGAVVRGSTLVISGLRLYFATQSQGTLKIEPAEKSSGESMESISMEVHTINSSVEIARGSAAGSAFKQLLSPAARYDLLQVLNLKNNGIESVELKYQPVLSGHILRDFHEYGYRQLKCKCETWEKSWQEKYPVDLRLLPIDEQLFSDWTKAFKEESFTLLLEPGKDITLGLYGSGDMLKAYIDRGVPNSSHEQREVIIGCEVSDPSDRKGPKEGIFRTISYSPIYGSVPNGLDVTGASLHINQGALVFELRNGLLTTEEDPATFSLKFLIEDFRVF